MAPTKWQKEPLDTRDGPNARWFNGPPPSAWTGPILSEWELRGQAWTDKHVHDEFAYVLEGQLFVESGGVTVEANPGDLVCVPAGSVGRYFAPKYARMLGVYGPNPDGKPMEDARLEQLGD